MEIHCFHFFQIMFDINRVKYFFQFNSAIVQISTNYPIIQIQARKSDTGFPVSPDKYFHVNTFSQNHVEL